MKKYIIETIEEQPVYENNRKVRTEILKGKIIQININFDSGDAVAIGKYYTETKLIKDIIFTIPEQIINGFIIGYNKLEEYDKEIFLDKFSNISYDLFMVEFSNYFNIDITKIKKTII